MFKIGSLEKLIHELSRLPGIGPKTAQRLAYHILRASDLSHGLQSALRQVQESVHLCDRCFSYTDEPALCRYCSDSNRRDELLCVVEEPADIVRVESSGAFRGRYHVLHGAISPLDNVSPRDLKIQELIDRVRGGLAELDGSPRVAELILALDPDLEGDTTALYLSKVFEGVPVKITRIASGVPIGSDIDFVDDRTLGRALGEPGGALSDMAFINPEAKEIHCKVVYYGPSLSGKTTNIQWVYQKTMQEQGGAGASELFSFNANPERTLFFDFLPMHVGEIRGLKTRFHLFTVPGQVVYDASRKLIMKGIDGVIFVADSQIERMEENVKAMQNLEKNLEQHGYDIRQIPLVLQYNKRDLPNAASLAELRTALNKHNAPDFEGNASIGRGVLEALRTVGKGIITTLKGGEV